MLETLRDFLNKKTVINLLLFGILVLGIPVGVRLVQTQQALKSKATIDPVAVVEEPGRVERRNGKLVALSPTITLRLTSPLGPPPAQRLVWSRERDNLVGKVYAGHAEGTEGWYCDNNQVWHDKPDGGHEIYKDCAPLGQVCTPRPPPAGYAQDADCVAQAPAAGQACSVSDGCPVSSNGLYCRGFDGGSLSWISETDASAKCQNRQATTAQCGGSTVAYCWSDGRWGSQPQIVEGQTCSTTDGCLVGSNNLYCRGFDGGSLSWISQTAADAKCDRGQARVAQCGGRDIAWCWDDGRWHLTAPVTAPVTPPTGGGPTRPSCFLSNVPERVPVNQEFLAVVRFSREPQGNDRVIVNWGLNDSENTVIAPGETRFKIPRSDGGSQYNIPFRYPNSGTYVITASLDDRTTQQSLCSNVQVSDRQRTIVAVSALPPTPPPTPPPAPPGSCSVDLKVNGSNESVAVENNATVNLSWTSQNADRVNASGAWSGGKTTSGSETTSPLSGPQSHTFSLTCYQNNSLQTVIDSVQVNVGGAPSPPTRGTVSFQISEDITILDSQPPISYNSHSMIYPFTFQNQTVGLKTIWVKFITNDGKVSGPHSFQIELAGPNPKFSGIGCTLEERTGSVIFGIRGENFGAQEGTVAANGANIEVDVWSNQAIRAILRNPTLTTEERQKFSLILTRPDGTKTEKGDCLLGVSAVSLGAKVFCRELSKQNQPNVELVLMEGTSSAKKVREKVTIDKDGLVTGLKTKLEQGKKYKLSLKAPKTLRRAIEFVAQEGTTIISNFILPVGDVAPKSGGDGKINSLDRAELNRQWSLSSISSSDRTADFNEDGRINSLDWACLRHDFNKEDDSEPN